MLKQLEQLHIILAYWSEFEQQSLDNILEEFIMVVDFVFPQDVVGDTLDGIIKYGKKINSYCDYEIEDSEIYYFANITLNEVYEKLFNHVGKIIKGKDAFYLTHPETRVREFAEIILKG